jgi:pseudouridine synthase, RluA family
MTVKKILINEENEGRRIDNFLISKFNTVPKSKIYNIIRKGEVRVNSSRKKPNYKLKVNDLIRIPPNLEISDKKIKIIKSEQILKHTKNILFENDNFIVANKRNDISVHGGTKNTFGLIDIFRKKYGNNLDLCHRLDKSTSGCIVFAKNKKAVKHFSKCLNNNQVKKIYSTILKGKINKSVNVDISIYKNSSSKSKVAFSKFILKKKLKNTSLVDVEIDTGRTHQIRIHASKLNHHIIFDKKYGDKDFDKSLNIGNHQIALHAKEIIFPDINNKIIRMKST